MEKIGKIFKNNRDNEILRFGKNISCGKGDEMKYFRIDINTELTDEQQQYIFDCWVAFVTNDLALMPADLMMYLDED